MKGEDLSNVIVGNSGAIKEIRNKILVSASVDSSVLITGESGTGKELIARQIHYSSSRSANPLVLLNLAALPSNLVETELQGYTKDVFTDAIKDKTGLIEWAHRGTLFLDQIGEASNKVQTLLLNVIEKKELRRLGENKVRPVDVRMIAASNSEVNDLTRLGRVRPNLLYQLATTLIQVPPLRERKQDIPLLVEHFLRRYKRQYQKRVEITDEALSALKKYDYPGNIRELENIIERAVVTSSGDKIAVENIDIPQQMGTILKPDPLSLISEINNLKSELDNIRNNSINASPIWDGRNFPTVSDYCFVLMPFADTYDIQKVYQDHVKLVLESRCGLRCERADDIYDIRGVMQLVWEGINRARLVVADLTGKNANVFYELGIAHTLGKPVVILTQSMEFVPSDLRHWKCIVYEYKPRTISKLETDLEKTVKRVLSGS
jgi:hypothetical protein